MTLYRDPETDQAIVTHSMLKTFRRCPKQAQYKYAMRLKRKVATARELPLRRGTWVHRLLEVYYKDEDWEAEHQRLSVLFHDLMDVEQDALGDLPRECNRLMRSYLWHYKDDPWKVHDAEFVLEVELPDGTLYRAKIDLLVENQYGLWIVDHKTHKSLPNLDFRLLDAQSALYIWAALKNKIPVQGHIWNYIRTTPPAVPRVVKAGNRFYAKLGDTDYLTFAKAVKKAGFDPKDYSTMLRRLKNERFKPGEPQLSPFFRRDILEKSPAMLKQVASEGYHTARRLNDYPFDRPALVERVVDRSCTWMCSYTDLCTLELFGGRIEPLLRQRYTVGDPMDYYMDQDTKEESDGSS